MLSDATRTALCGALLDALFPSGQAAQIEIMAGLLPATMPAGGTVLLRIEVTLADVTASGPSIRIPAGLGGAFVAAGTAGWARWIDGDGGHRLYLPCTSAPQAGAMALNDLRIAIGTPVRTMASTITIGGA